MAGTPKVSVIIPVYNVEKYLRQCLDSVVNQTLREIEIICVDDGSTDRSLEILREYNRNDGRVRTVFFEASRSAMEARREGVRLAEGEYVLFLDADDYLETEACEELYRKAVAEQVDILQFSSKVENCADLPEQRIQRNQEMLAPLECRLEGREVFVECFLKKSYGFTLWNKLIRTELCKQAFSKMGGGYLPKAQDLYTYFAIAYFAKSYLGWKSKYYHHYCFGRGVTANAVMTLDKFQRYCMQAKVLEALKSFCQEQQIADTDTLKIICRLQEQWVQECVMLWFDLATSQKAEEATEILFRCWGAETVITAIIKKYWYSRDLIADRIGRIPGGDLAGKKVRTVGIYYYHYTVGGVQRVLSLLAPMLQKMGFQVVLITDKAPTENEFAPIDGVPRLMVQDYRETNRSNYAQRMEDWKHIVENWKIDLVLYNAWTSNLLLWDMLYLKNHGVSVVVQTHSVFSYALLKLGKDFAERPKLLGLADGIVTLSEVDRVFWSVYNDRVWRLPNPVDPQLREASKTGGAAPIITWIGRFSNEKQPWEALRIMELVVQNRPDAVLYMIGDGAERSLLDRYRKMAEERGIEKQVQFLGYQSDVSQFLQKASVNLITSSYEGYSMVLVEAQAHGVPSVMYRMPYLDLCREELGVIAVNPGDRQGAATALTALLDDRALWEENHRRANRSFEELAKYDFAGEWQKVLNGSCPRSNLNRTEMELVRTITEHYLIGWKYVNLSEKRRTAERDEAALIRASWTYRIGWFITFIPRKIRGGVRCFNEHGWQYTWQRLLVHLGLKEDPYK